MLQTMIKTEEISEEKSNYRLKTIWTPLVESIMRGTKRIFNEIIKGNYDTVFLTDTGARPYGYAVKEFMKCKGIKPPKFCGINIHMIKYCSELMNPYCEINKEFVMEYRQNLVNRIYRIEEMYNTKKSLICDEGPSSWNLRTLEMCKSILKEVYEMRKKENKEVEMPDTLNFLAPPLNKEINEDKNLKKSTVTSIINPISKNGNSYNILSNKEFGSKIPHSDEDKRYASCLIEDMKYIGRELAKLSKRTIY